LPIGGAFMMTPAELRVRAQRVRALARSVAHDEAAPILRAFADELDAKAEASEEREDPDPGQRGCCHNPAAAADCEHRTPD